MTRRGLGRGLGALIPAIERRGVEEVDVDLIVPNPQQPRSPISDDSLTELVDSMREHGVIQPLLVAVGDTPGVYQLIAGERRLRAARIAGIARVPVIVKEAAPRELLELALVENLQREDLNPMEEAQAYRRLADEFKLTQEQIAERVGRSRAAIANALRLLHLDAEIQESLLAGAISEGHARALLGIEDEPRRRATWRQVVDRGLTVRDTETLVRRARHAPTEAPGAPGAPGAPAGPTPSVRSDDTEIAALEERLRRALGTKVELHHRRSGRGRLVLHYFSDEELEALLARLGVDTGGGGHA